MVIIYRNRSYNKIVTLTALFHKTLVFIFWQEKTFVIKIIYFNEFEAINRFHNVLPYKTLLASGLSGLKL
jgi:hypothetical protein